MRHSVVFVLILASLVPGISRAQIPNAGFEDWTMGNPNDWNTSNAQGIAINITQSGNFHGGASAVAGVVADFSSFPWPPVIISGADARGFPVSTRHEALHGWYQFSPAGPDQLAIILSMNHADSSVGGGAAVVMNASSVYQEFVANIIYAYPQVPDTCIISATIFGTGGGLPQIGSSFLIDDLSFGPVSAVDESGNVIPGEYALLQNYPNPFNPATTIQYSIPRAGRVSLVVYDLMGREISRLVDEEQGAGSYRVPFDASSLSSGVYFYRLQSGGFSQVRNLIVVK